MSDRRSRVVSSSSVGNEVKSSGRLRNSATISTSTAAVSSMPGGYALSAVGAWVPNVAFTAIGAGLLLRAARY